MYEGRRILVVVPARGGSKGVPLKNIRALQGRPLIAHVAELVSGVDWIDRAVVSTDHPEIARVARDHGLDAPFRRPEALSGDEVGDVPVLQHALSACEALDGCTYDVIVMLQPTSPLRRVCDVEATVAALVAEGRDAVWTVSSTDRKYHPLKQLAIEEGRLRLCDPAGARIVARQQLSPTYHRNGAAYALTRACLMEQGVLLGDNSGAVVVEEPRLSIDTEDDFARAENALATRAADRMQRGRIFVVDIDGVLATIVPDNHYPKAEPIRENVARVNALHAAGHRIVLFTARGSATGLDWERVTRDQLAAWGVRFDELRFGKPAADYYIDDRMITLDQAAADANLERRENQP